MLKNSLKVFVLITGLTLATSAHAHTTQPAKYYRISKVEIQDVTEQYPKFATQEQGSLKENCEATNEHYVLRTSADPDNGLGGLVSVIDEIINMGQKIWKIVDAGRPVSKWTTQTANALPKGLKCWVDLAGWQIPQTKVYKISYKNGFGAEVVTFAFRLSFTYGGNFNGVGQYVTNATIMPAEINVAWGFTFNADATIPSVFNTGTMNAPVAGMQMVVNWSVDTVLKHSQQSETFYVSGDGKLVHLD